VEFVTFDIPKKLKITFKCPGASQRSVGWVINWKHFRGNKIHPTSRFNTTIYIVSANLWCIYVLKTLLV